MQILIVIAAYLLGSVPFGLIITRRKNKDIRKIGSGNIGATNVHRALGIKYAVLVGLLDVAKGAVPAYIASQLFTSQYEISLVALAALLGHIFPVYTKFKGGKGIATFAGTLIVIWGIKIFAVLLLLWIISLALTRLMSITNLLLSIFTPLISFYILHSLPYTYYTVIAAILIWLAHRKNIQRLYRGQEKKLTFSR